MRSFLLLCSVITIHLLNVIFPNGSSESTGFKTGTLSFPTSDNHHSILIFIFPLSISHSFFILCKTKYKIRVWVTEMLGSTDFFPPKLVVARGLEAA